MLRKGIDSVNRLAVSAYKGLGFVILLLILLGLGGYIGINLFYLFNRGWIAPVIVSPTDERVVTLNSELAAQSYQRRKLEVERMTLELELGHVDRAIELNQSFQEGFQRAIEADAVSRRQELADLSRVVREYERQEAEIRSAREAYAGSTRERSTDELAAHLIDRQTFLQRNYLLAQIAQSELQFAQARQDLTAQSRNVARRAGSVEALRAELSLTRSGWSRRGSDYDVLQMQRAYEESRLELEKIRNSRRPLQRQLEAIDESLQQYDQILASIRNSPYLRAIDSQLTIAFVPYDNADNVQVGDNLYACDLSIVWCRNIGRVLRPLDGEVSARHPLNNREIRGRMVEIRLKSPRWAENATLHVDRAPFFI